MTIGMMFWLLGKVALAGDPECATISDYTEDSSKVPIRGCGFSMPTDYDLADCGYTYNTDVKDGELDCSSGSLTIEKWYSDFDADGHPGTELLEFCPTGKEYGLEYLLDENGEFYYCDWGTRKSSKVFTDGDDCDDDDPTAYPGAVEICDGVDNDCDGSVDEGVTNKYRLDADDDNHSDAGDTDWVSCWSPTPAYKDVTTLSSIDDCDDNNPLIHPGATELCDALDNDCDGALSPTETDDDADAFVECTPEPGAPLRGGDCDDMQPRTYPFAEELCDGEDNDCNGALPEKETDDDGDGFVECKPQETSSLRGEDCDDFDSETYPGATERCDNLDNDCNGSIPEDEIDNDSDDYVECNQIREGFEGSMSPGDCDDDDPETWPEALELCDGKDNDCDDAIPDNETDDDGDEFVECPTIRVGFEGTLNPGDCDDDDMTINPGVPYDERNGIDADCDGKPIGMIYGCSAGCSPPGAHHAPANAALVGLLSLVLLGARRGRQGRLEGR